MYNILAKVYAYIPDATENRKKLKARPPHHKWQVGSQSEKRLEKELLHCVNAKPGLLEVYFIHFSLYMKQ